MWKKIFGTDLEIVTPYPNNTLIAQKKGLLKTIPMYYQ